MQKTVKTILDRIDAINPKRDLGITQLSKPIVFSYRDVVDVNDENIVNISWKKRYYNYNRGDYFALDPYSFNAYTSKIYKTTLATDKGNIVDYADIAYANIQYGTSLYVENNTLVSFKIEIPDSSITIYVNGTEIFKSEDDSPYISNQTVISLQQGWNDIYVYVYTKAKNTKIMLIGNLAKKVSACLPVDFEGPGTPEWADSNPVSLEYIDPKNSPNLQIVLRWNNPIYTNVESANSIAGWGLYLVNDRVKLTDGSSDITIVSGWGSGTNLYSFMVSGDKRLNFYTGLYLTGTSSALSGKVVSGTSYPIGANSETKVDLTTTYNSSLVFNVAQKDRTITFRDITKENEILNTSAKTNVISGTITSNFVHGQTYLVTIDAFDDSMNKNRSDFADFQTIKIHPSNYGYPGSVPQAMLDNAGVWKGDLKAIYGNVLNPEYWPEPKLQVRGYKVYDQPNWKDKSHCVGTFPLNVSGSGTEVHINKRKSGTEWLTLLDATAYTFYISCYDWYGNEEVGYNHGYTLTTNITGTTSVSIKTSQGNGSVELDSTTNTLKIYADITHYASGID